MSKMLGARGGVQCGWGDGELGGEVEVRASYAMTIMVDSSVYRPSHELGTEDA